MQETTDKVEEKEINISNIFQKKSNILTSEIEEKQQVKEIKPEKQDKKEQPKNDKNNQKDESEDDSSDDEDILDSKDEKKESTATKENINYQIELENTQKKLKETQKWGNEANKKLSAYSKAIEKLKEDSVLTEDEAKLLTDYTYQEALERKDKTPLERFGEVWDKEITYMRKYSTNPQEIDQFVWSFQHYLQNAPREEIKEIMEEFEDLEDKKDEIEFTKRMLEIGKQWNDEIYRDIHEAGGLKNLKKLYAEKEKKLKNTIDKQQKDLDKLKKNYEDYSENPNMGLPSGSSPDNPSQEVTMDVAKIFSKRFQPRN